MEINNKIKYLREERDLLQFEVADKIGIARNTLSQIERARSLPSYDVLIKIANLFEVSTDYLLGLEDEFGVKVEKTEKSSEIEAISKLIRKIKIEITSLNECQLSAVIGYIARIKEEKK